MSNLKYRRSLLATTMISGAIMAAAASPAFAQETQTSDDQATVEDVVVTGSRIVRQDFAAISPVTTVTSETIELTATLTVENLLNQLPSVVAGNMNTSNNAGGEEFATVDLRGLGAQRTLVLVNGERVPASSTTGVVDLNTIPASLIERVEVVTGGASAVYGSDALAGVVNFILKDNFEGAEMNVSYGSDFEGNSPEYEINGLFGGSFANGRGNLTTYASYYKREGTYQSEFDYSAVSGAVIVRPDGTYGVVDSSQEFNDARQAWIDSGQTAGSFYFYSGGSATSAWGTVYNNANNAFNVAALNGLGSNFSSYDHDCNPATPNVTYGAAGVSRNLSFNPSGALTPIANVGGCAVPDRAAGSSRYNFAPDNYLVIPAERFTISTIGHYDITDDIRLRVQLNYVNSTQQVSLAPTPATGLTVTLTPAMQSLISTNHPDLWAALQSRPNPLASFTMDRRMNEVGARTGASENNALSMLGTLTGKFTDTWDWSLTASYGLNNFTSTGENSTNRTALAQGLAGCQDLAGNALVGLLPNCVPLDIFGEGTLTDSMVNFLTVPTFATTEIREKRVAGFVRGSLFNLPAGPISAVFGAEYRESKADFRVDDMQRTGNIFGFNAIQNQAGSVDVSEVYTEVAIPLLADLPFANYVGLEAGARYSDYNTIGGVDTYKVGAEWAPVDWMKFRAMYNTAVRAPSVFELFQNGDQGFAGYTDPCASNNADAALLAFCSAQAGGYDFSNFTQANSQTEAFAFGNPNLAPEEAETTTIGLVFQPQSPVGTFRASVDYYDIEITNLVASLGAGYWINDCYGNAGSTPPTPGAEGCSRVVRDPLTGQIDYVNTSRTNLGYQRTKGYDFQLDYVIDGVDFGMPGRLRINELFTYVDSLDYDGDEYAGTSAAYIGGGIFDWKSVLSVSYDISDFTFFARWTYIPELEDIAFGSNYIDGSPTYTPSANYLDFTTRYNVSDNLQLTAFIGNVFDKTTPQIASGVPYGQANTDTQVYRTFGRTFNVSLKARF